MTALIRVTWPAVAGLFLATFAVLAGEAAPDVAPGERADKAPVEQLILGKWVLERDTPVGRFRTVKEHFGDHTVVTTYDPQQQPVESHRSKYRVDASGSVPVFRYRDRVVLIGPDAGAQNPQEMSYIFRIEGKQFYEVHGMLPGDTGRPSLIVWDRLDAANPPK